MSGGEVRARLFSKTGEMAGAEFEIGREATIGRNADNAIVLPSRRVSGAHARIRYEPEAARYVLEDLGSLNGTELDGLPVTGPEPLRRLHVIRFAGSLDFIFLGPEITAGLPQRPEPATPPSGPPEGGTVVDAEPPVLPPALAAERAAEPGSGPAGGEPAAEPRERTVVDAEPPVLPPALAAERAAAGGPGGPAGEAREPPARRPVMPDATLLDTEPLSDSSLAAGAERAGGEYALRVTNLEAPAPFPLRSGDNLVGRDPDAEVRLSSPEISRRHAVLTVRAGKVFVRDAGSRNRTFVGRVRVGEEAVEIEAGATLRFGSVEAELVRGDEGG